MARGRKIEVVSSNNTNLSPSGKLPVLIDGSQIVEGFGDIARYIEGNWTFEGDYCKENDVSAELGLLNRSLEHLVVSELKYLVQYNLYVNSNNYENHVRKLFKHYLPFPMMYNQPLKYYNIAKEQVKLIGIGVNQKRFLSFGDADEEADTKPISKLHEKQLMLKNKEKMSLTESKNTLRAMSLTDEFLKKYETIQSEKDTDTTEKIDDDAVGSFSSLVPGKFLSSDLLFLAFISSLTHELPDMNLHNIVVSHKPLHQWVQTSTNTLRKNTSIPILAGQGNQVPNLLNEITYKWSQLSNAIGQYTTSSSI